MLHSSVLNVLDCQACSITFISSEFTRREAIINPYARDIIKDLGI